MTQVNNYKSKKEPSRLAPLKTDLCPQFVVFGFDDNGISGLDNQKADGLQFILDLFASGQNPVGRKNPLTFDYEAPTATFYITTIYAEQNKEDRAENVRKQWLRALTLGHELGCHAHTHPHGEKLSSAEWQEEIENYFRVVETEEANAGLGLKRDSIIGFRAPFIEYNRNLYKVIAQHNFKYDCSIEEGVMPEEDGTNFFWPYTLDFPSPGNKYLYEGNPLKSLEPVPGLWELPCYSFLVPPKELCSEYELEPEIWERLKKINPFFNGRITGFDWNLWIFYKLTDKEFYGILKYNLVQRLKGNRCPFMVGVHSDIYSAIYDHKIALGQFKAKAPFSARMDALAEFYKFALSIPEVRIVSAEKLISWLSNPTAL